MTKSEAKELRTLADTITGDVRYNRLNKFTSCLLKLADEFDPQTERGGDHESDVFVVNPQPNSEDAEE